MAKKGDRGAKEPLAMRMYAEQRSLTEIAAVLDVSETSLRKWKAESLRPGDDLDAWDKSRQAKCSRLDGLREMFDENFEAMKGLQPLQRDSKMMDSLTKLGALIEKWEGMEERARKAALTSAANVIGEEARAQGMDAAQAEFWLKKVLSVA
jgi:hypothetical protein